MPKVTIREGWREEILSVRARSGAEQHLRSCGFDSDDTWLYMFHKARAGVCPLELELWSTRSSSQLMCQAL